MSRLRQACECGHSPIVHVEISGRACQGGGGAGVCPCRGFREAVAPAFPLPDPTDGTRDGLWDGPGLVDDHTFKHPPGLPWERCTVCGLGQAGHKLISVPYAPAAA